jgi:hypothetical protein
VTKLSLVKQPDGDCDLGMEYDDLKVSDDDEKVKVNEFEVREVLIMLARMEKLKLYR